MRKNSEKRKKISTILPVALLNEAVRLSNANQTDTLIAALQDFVRAFKRRTILDLKGKINIDFDIEKDRERSRF